MTKDLQCNIDHLMQDSDLRKKIDVSKYVTDTIELPTLNDILNEMTKPARDPREEFETI